MLSVVTGLYVVTNKLLSLNRSKLLMIDDDEKLKSIRPCLNQKGSYVSLTF